MVLTAPRTNDIHEKTRYDDALIGLPAGGSATGGGGGAILPNYGIILWDYRDAAGNYAAIPTGWQVCDGTNGTYDMRGKLPMGAYSGHAVGTTEGALTHTHAGPSHTHGDGDLGCDFTSTGPNESPAVLAGAGGLSVAPYDHTHDVSGNVVGTTAAGGTGNTGNNSVLPVPVIYMDYIKKMS